MYLHNEKEKFIELITQVGKAWKVDQSIIEKDYYVTLILKRLLEKEPLIIFKGGTCLSKCYKIIDRFSEDIDVNLENVNSQTQSRKKQMSVYVMETIDELGFTLTNGDRIASGRSHNNYRVAYPSLFSQGISSSEIQVETMFLVDTFPTQKMPVSSFLYDYLLENGYDGVIEQYAMQPYEITAQSLERTFVDKVFALGTHYLSNRMNRQSRHLYDLHKILPHVKLNDDLRNLFDEVRVAWSNRKGNKEWTAAEDVEDLPKLLREIVNTEAYRQDYERVTSRLLFDYVPYEEVIGSFKKIVSGLESGAEM